MHILKGLPVGQFTTGVDGIQLPLRPGILQIRKMLGFGHEFFIPPHADRIEVFQAQSDEIETGMAGSALRFLLVNFNQGSDTWQRLSRRINQLRNIWRRWRWRIIEENLLHQRAANDRRGAIAHRPDREERGLSGQPASRRAGGQAHLLKAIARVVIRQAIFRGEHAVDGDKVGINQVLRRQVFLHQGFEELHRLLLHGNKVGIGEVEEKAGTQPDAFETFQMHPLGDKTLVKPLRARMAQHALGLFQQDRFLKQRSVRRDLHQFFIRWPAPEKRSQSVGQADRIQGPSPLLFADIWVHQVEKARRRQDERQRIHHGVAEAFSITPLGLVIS